MSRAFSEANPSRNISPESWRLTISEHRPNSTVDSLIAQNRLDVIGDVLRNDSDYYAQTNSDDLILDAAELAWLKKTLGARIAVYDHGGHLGNLGDRQQVADMLDMLGGRWKGSAP